MQDDQSWFSYLTYPLTFIKYIAGSIWNGIASIFSSDTIAVETSGLEFSEAMRRRFRELNLESPI